MKLQKVEIYWLILFGVLALFTRVAFIYVGTSRSALGAHDDDYEYTYMAQTLISQGTYQSNIGTPPYRAWRPPLSPVLLSLIFKIHGSDSHLPVRFYLAFLSLLVPLGTWWLARKLWNPLVGLFAYAWACFHPAFIMYGAYAQNDSFFLPFATVGLALLITQRTLRQTVFAGLFIGLAILGRSQFAGAALLGLAWSFLPPFPESKRKWSVGFLLGLMLVLGPWWIRNYRVLHHFVPLSTEGGYTFLLGLNPLAEGGSVDILQSEHSSKLGEVANNKHYYKQGFEYIRTHPEHTLQLAVSKLSRFWALTPQTGGIKTKAFSFLVYFPMFASALLALWIWRKQTRSFLPIYGMCLYYTITQSLFVSVMRYRLPLEPLFIVLGSATFCWVVLRMVKPGSRIESVIGRLNQPDFMAMK